MGNGSDGLRGSCVISPLSSQPLIVSGTSYSTIYIHSLDDGDILFSVKRDDASVGQPSHRRALRIVACLRQRKKIVPRATSVFQSRGPTAQLAPDLLRLRLLSRCLVPHLQIVRPPETPKSEPVLVSRTWNIRSEIASLELLLLTSVKSVSHRQHDVNDTARRRPKPTENRRRKKCRG